MSSLKGQVTSSNAERVVKMMEEMRGLWAELEQGTQTRDEGMLFLICVVSAWQYCTLHL